MDTSIKESYSLLSNLVYNSIKEAIVKGELEPGRKISETKLAKELGVSRTPVRESLRILYAEGFIRLTPNSSFVVNEFTSEDAIEVLNVRRLLEGEAARLAAMNINDEAREIIRKQRAVIPEYIAYTKEHTGIESMDYDIEFHKDIYRICGNKRLAELGDQLKDKQVRIHLAEGWKKIDFGKIFTDQHSLIMDAIEAGDPDKAEQMAHAHIDYLLSLIS